MNFLWFLKLSMLIFCFFRHFSPWAGTFFGGPLGGQNIISIFRNLRVSPFQKSMRGCSNWWLLPKIEGFLWQTRIDQRGDLIKMTFDYIQIQKWMLQTVRTEKLDEKNGVIRLVSIFPSWAMACKLSKKVHF